MASCTPPFVAVFPPPYTKVRIRVSNDDPRSIIVSYTGLPHELLALGAIEPHMLKGARTCGSGPNYRRWSSGTRGRIHVVRYIHSSDELLALPGCSVEDIPQIITWLGQNPGRLHVSINRYGERSVGASEALIAHGLASPDDFSFDDARDLPDAPGYQHSSLERCVDGYYCVQRFRLQSQPEAVTSRPGRPSYLRLVVDNTQGVRL
jgi:hypothetical protein